MAVHVGEITSEVVADTATPDAVPPAGADAERPWDALARLRELDERRRADALRTMARSFDD